MCQAPIPCQYVHLLCQIVHLLPFCLPRLAGTTFFRAGRIYGVMWTIIGLFHICTLCLVLTLCFEELGTETVAALQRTETDAGGSTGIIDIALPVRPDDDTAVTVIPTAREYRLCTLRSYLRQD